MVQLGPRTKATYQPEFSLCILLTAFTREIVGKPRYPNTAIIAWLCLPYIGKISVSSYKWKSRSKRCVETSSANKDIDLVLVAILSNDAGRRDSSDLSKRNSHVFFCQTLQIIDTRLYIDRCDDQHISNHM